MGFWADLIGTTKTILQIGTSGVNLSNSSGNLVVRNAANNADSQITASQLNNSGNSIVVNSDAAGSGADWTYTLGRPASGMTAAVVLTLPPDDGAAGQSLITDGSGNLSWNNETDQMRCEEVALAFGTSSPLAVLTLPANGYIEKVCVLVDTPFNGTAPTLVVGVAGTTDKYVEAGDVNLKSAGQYIVHPGEIPTTAESVIGTYVADSSSAGAARIQVYYSIPA
jgi:hypothetical protein